MPFLTSLRTPLAIPDWRSHLGESGFRRNWAVWGCQRQSLALKGCHIRYIVLCLASTVQRRVPPLESIEAFLAVAEAGGVRAAARTLSLSASATSRRITALETFLEVALFDRANGGLQLTDAGCEYRNAVETAIEALSRASVAHRTGEKSTLTIAASHSLALRWLIPGSGEFTRQTGIRLDVRPTRDSAILRSGEAQIAIWASFHEPDLLSEKVLEVHARPIAAPALMEAHSGKLVEADLCSVPLLAPRLPENVWPRWLALAGLEHDQINLHLFDTSVLAYEAAVAGFGVALAVPFMCEDHIARGTLLPFGQKLAIGEHYKLYRCKSRAGLSERERHFIHWVRREAKMAADRFAALT